MNKGRQVLLREFNQPLELREVDIPSPSAREVLVRVEMAGVCGSDVHTWRGEIPRALPIVLGHEGLGTIAALGSQVRMDPAGQVFKEGDRVYWSPTRACYRCRACVIEKDPSACENKSVYGPVGAHNRNSYADYAMLSLGDTVYRIPDDTPSDAIIAFGCAMPTVQQAFDRLGQIEMSRSFVVQGCGPVGLAGVLLARCLGLAPIVALDRFEDRLDLARAIGATHTVMVSADCTPAERIQKVRAICENRGGDIVLEATGNIHAFSEGLQFVARGGSYLIVGLWAGQGKASLDPHEVLRRNIRIIGSAYAGPSHFYRAIRVAQQFHKHVPMANVVTSRFHLKDALQALLAVQEGKPGKAILEPGRP